MGQPLHVSTQDMEVAYNLIYKMKSKIKFEFIIAKCLQSRNEDYRIVPLYWTDQTLEKYEKLWQADKNIDFGKNKKIELRSLKGLF
jgi:hypothetical protein